ncbi:MAG: aspartate--tRNA ligase, partial [Parachlamydiales bacterium]
MFDYRRTHNCGALTKTDNGKKATLSGWVNKTRNLGGLIFIDLRDKFGLTQIVFDPAQCPHLMEKAATLRSEWVISVKGEVALRQKELVNSKMKTGEIELKPLELEVLSKAQTPPFTISDEKEANEELRLKYRYLDLRRGFLLKKLELRHLVVNQIRDFFFNEHFIEIETPILCKTTPEGSRDYLVPSRIYPGNFFALPQSPQLYKQLLMLGSLDRYFQIARCFRDEDLRSDRQPEFTQVDLEMSFAFPEDLQALMEKLMQRIFKNCLNLEITLPFRRLTYQEALEKYGTDKPDLRFAMALHHLDSLLETSQLDSPLKASRKNHEAVKGFLIRGGADLSRKALDGLAETAKQLGAKGLFYLKKDQGQLASGCAKFFTQEELKKIDLIFESRDQDLILIASGKENLLNQALDHLRRQIAKQRGLIDP